MESEQKKMKEPEVEKPMNSTQILEHTRKILRFYEEEKAKKEKREKEKNLKTKTSKKNSKE